MKAPLQYLAAIGLLTATSLALADEASQVIAPSIRKEAVARAEALLSHKDLRIPANATDPFHSEAFADFANPNPGPKPGPSAPGPRTDREILAGIAAGLTPSGMFVMDGQRTLLFGQKRVKPGTTLTINFEGAEYIVEVTAIDNTSFTLRLNREEITRPIK